MNATCTDCRRAAFTLVELLVVIGLMAMLATVSVAGYSAANRGMADRGALEATRSTLRVAQQTCVIDRVPTKVMFFNQLLSNDGDADSATLYQGTAIAIKQAGRITVNSGASGIDMLVDEFADWNQSYPSAGSEGQSGMRLFRMKHSDEGKDMDGCSAVVNSYVTRKDIPRDYMIQRGMTIKDWCDNHASGNAVIWGLEIVSGLSEWEAGDPYGVEIARIDLPKGYIFGSDKPKKQKPEPASVPAVTFDPAESDPLMSKDVPVCLMRPNKKGSYEAKEVGKITKDMLKDTFK